MRTILALTLALSSASALAQDASRAPGPAERAVISAIGTIETRDDAVNAVLAIDPTAIRQAQEIDKAQMEGPLVGVPVLLKDNIEAKGPLPTTAGSLALKENVTNRDAPLVAGLREAGAVILGKTNLSEWANFRSEGSNSGWSAVGGQTRNPYALDRSPCGSSSGSGAAVAAGMVDIAIGTETDGSVTCPASMNGIVGFKPTVGMVSRTHIVPLSATQDTAGPMTKTVFQAAAVMDAIAGDDAADPATEGADRYRGTFAKALEGASLKGVRLGVLEFTNGQRTDALFEVAKKQLEAQGAILVPIAEMETEADGEAEYTVLLTEFRDGINRYLAAAPDAVEARTLADLIAFNEATPRELAIFDQSIFEKAEKTRIDDPAYAKALEASKRTAGAEGIDRMMKENDVEALIFPTAAPAMLIDHVFGDDWHGGGAGNLAAMAGYPHLTVPMGLFRGLPVGLSFMGKKWDDAHILALGHAYEQGRPAIPAPQFHQSVMENPDVAPYLSKVD